MAQRSSSRKPDSTAMMFAHNLAIQDFLTNRQKDIRAHHKQKSKVVPNDRMDNKGNSKISSHQSPKVNQHSNIYIETTDTEAAHHSMINKGNTSRRLSEEATSRPIDDLPSLSNRLSALERKFEFQEHALKEAVSVMRSVQQSHVRQIQENEVM
jgi:hypothetical protein